MSKPEKSLSPEMREAYDAGYLVGYRTSAAGNAAARRELMREILQYMRERDTELLTIEALRLLFPKETA